MVAGPLFASPSNAPYSIDSPAQPDNTGAINANYVAQADAIRVANNNVRNIPNTSYAFTVSQTFNGPVTFNGTSSFTATTYLSSATVLNGTLAVSSTNVSIGGFNIAYGISVASAQIGAAGIDVTTFTVPVGGSTGTYVLRWNLTVVGADTGIRVRFNGDASSIYQTHDSWMDSTGASSGDSGQLTANCYVTASGRLAKLNTIVFGHYDIGANGSMVDGDLSTKYHENLTNETKNQGGCSYNGSSVLSSINLATITSGGKYQGHIELIRTQ